MTCYRFIARLQLFCQVLALAQVPIAVSWSQERPASDAEEIKDAVAPDRPGSLSGILVPHESNRSSDSRSAREGCISVGVKLRIPLTDIVRTAGDIGYMPYTADTGGFAIGPVLDIRFPLGLGAEIGAIFKKFDQHAGQVQMIVEPGVPYQELYSPYSNSGQSWEIPIAAQYRFPGTSARPYVEGGFSFNRLRDLLVPFKIWGPASQSQLVHSGITQENRFGFLVGGGLEIKLHFMRIIPGVRYVHYSEIDPWRPSVGVADFLVGFTS